jgi:hypothetical protein
MGVVVAERKSSLILTGLMVGLFALLGFLVSIGYSRLADWFDQAETPRVMLTASADCDLSQEVCTLNSEGLSVSVYSSNNVQALKPFSFQVGLDGPLADTAKGVAVHFTMVGMDMGINRFHLRRKLDQHWQGEVILPLCTKGRSDWIATVEVETEPPYGVQFPLTVH